MLFLFGLIMGIWNLAIVIGDRRPWMRAVSSFGILCSLIMMLAGMMGAGLDWLWK